MKALEPEQAVLLSAYTGFMCVNDFCEVHAYVEQVMGRAVFTHEFADPEFNKALRAILKPRFLQLIP